MSEVDQVMYTRVLVGSAEGMRRHLVGGSVLLHHGAIVREAGSHLVLIVCGSSESKIIIITIII